MEAVDASWARRALPGFFSPLEVVASVPTTMARAAELAAAGAPEGATVVTEEQTEGRGRLGRVWVAPDAVWLTVAAAGVALAGAVDEVAPGAAPAGLKWPNDLELGGRKAAGLLAEARLEGTRLAAVLLGMGVNVGQGAGDFPAEMAGRATSVSLAAGAPVDRGELLAAWAGRFRDGYAELCAGRPGPVLAAYRERLVTVGRQVRADRIGAGPVVGTAVDLTPAGHGVVEAAGDPPPDQAGLAVGAGLEHGRGRQRPPGGVEQLAEQPAGLAGGEAGRLGLGEHGGRAAVGDQPPQGPPAPPDPPLRQPGHEQGQVVADQPGHRPGGAAGRRGRGAHRDLGQPPPGKGQQHVAGGQVGCWPTGGQGGEQGPGQGPGVALEQGRGGPGRAVAAEPLPGQLELEVQLERDRAEQVVGGQPGHGSAPPSGALRTGPEGAAWGRSGRSA